MSLEYEGMSPVWEETTDKIGYVYTVIFIIEMILKIVAFGLSYFSNG